MSQRSPDHTLPDIDHSFLEETLLQLMAIPSPVGLTDGVVRYTAARLEAIGLPYEVTRRGAIRATLSLFRDADLCAIQELMLEGRMPGPEEVKKGVDWVQLLRK